MAFKKAWTCLPSGFWWEVSSLMRSSFFMKSLSATNWSKVLSSESGLVISLGRAVSGLNFINFRSHSLEEVPAKLLTNSNFSSFLMGAFFSFFLK